MTTETNITEAELAEALNGHEAARKALRARTAQVGKHIKALKAAHPDLNTGD
jgi:hypothetical protein